MAERDFQPRAMMEKAIEVMLQSVEESRKDGKVAPKVGALLIVSYESGADRNRLITAHRGELREGDHAEYTLIERKCRDRKLDGSVLFATLEPCAPGARRHPKLGCAERIVLARIKEVWVGIEDPDPTVDRKGIKYLQDNGITVHMFDRDLQDRIREANKDFINQALERAAAAREEKSPQIVTLSPFENPIGRAIIDDLSPDALKQYLDAVESNDTVDSASFHRRLSLQGLLKEERGSWVPSGFGLLLFGKEPRLHMPQAGLLGTIHFADGREELRDFDGAQVLVPDAALRWVRDKLPDPVDRTEAKRKLVYESLFELTREGIVNALVHRDYDVKGAKCQLIATPEMITIKSPGLPQSPITLDQMQSFTAPMLSRNPILHFVFSQMDLAEERGLGLKSLKQKAEKAGLPLPVYSWEDPYLVLTIYRSAESVSRTLKPEVLEALNDDELSGWAKLTTLEEVTKTSYAKVTGYDDRKAQRHLKQFVDLGLLRRVGRGKATEYQIIR